MQYIEGKKTAKKFWNLQFYMLLDVKNMEKLIDLLEENDDVQNVYHNWEQD